MLKYKKNSLQMRLNHEVDGFTQVYIDYIYFIMDSEEDNNHEKLRLIKSNGFYCPLHRMQVLSWVITLLVSVTFYSLVAHGFASGARYTLKALFSLSLAAIFIVMMIATCIDPTDRTVLKFRRSKREKIAFVLNQQQQMFSSIADSVTDVLKILTTTASGSTTVSEANNYKYFALLIALFLVHNTFIVVVCAVENILSHTSSDFAGSEHNFEEYYGSENASLAAWLSYGACYVLIAICACICFTTGHLILFHIYLKTKELSTYNYIILQRKSKERKTISNGMNKSACQEIDSNCSKLFGGSQEFHPEHLDISNHDGASLKLNTKTFGN